MWTFYPLWLVKKQVDIELNRCRVLASFRQQLFINSRQLFSCSTRISRQTELETSWWTLLRIWQLKSYIFPQDFSSRKCHSAFAKYIHKHMFTTRWSISCLKLVAPLPSSPQKENLKFSNIYFQPDHDVKWAGAAERTHWQHTVKSIIC